MRIPDQRLSAGARFLMWALGISYGVVSLFGFIAGLALRSALKTGTARTSAGGAMSAGCIMGVAGLALLVFGIMYLLMLEKFGKAFKQQEAFARQTWAAQPATAA